MFKMWSRSPGAFSGEIKRACFGTNWVAHQCRYQLRLNKARCQIQRAKTTCFTEKCGEPDGRWRPGRSRAPSSCVWLGRDLDSSRTRLCSANVHRSSSEHLHNLCLDTQFQTQLRHFSIHPKFFFTCLTIPNVLIKFSLWFSKCSTFNLFFGCYTCLTAEFVIIREKEKDIYKRFVWGNVIN